MELAYAGLALLDFVFKMVVAGFALVVGGHLAAKMLRKRK